MKKKIAIVNQRYGAEVNGGSEYYTKKLAEHLQPYYDIEVLTTTALDYDTWAPYYPEGEQVVDGVSVRRFTVKFPRNITIFRIVNKLLQMFPRYRALFEPFWIKAQGPYCPRLIQYIGDHRDDYDIFIFVTYLYYTTALGMPEVAEKTIFVPTAHDEYCIYFFIYKKLFKKAKGIVYLTEEERDFVQKLFNNKMIPHQVAGTGIDVPEQVNPEMFRKKYEIDFDYIIYVGRVDDGKNCDELFDFFTKYCQRTGDKIRLVLIGKMMMKQPRGDLIHSLGFVSEEDKYAAMAGAKALIMPSMYESLSLVVLEAMALGIPVLVNGCCAVLEGHCRKSGAGISYRNYSEFECGLEKLLYDERLQKRMRQAGKGYIRNYYSWDEVIEKYVGLIEK